MPDTDDDLRLFLALWPGPAARDQAAACQFAQHWPAETRLVAPADLHVTLHFLGMVPRMRLPDLCTKLDVPARRVAVTLDRLELWQKGVAVLAGPHVPPALSELHARLADRLRSLGMSVDDRPYRPHMTLARKASGMTFEPVRPIRLQAAQYAVAASQRGNHTRLCQYPLQGPARA